jgi:hypothetical protein
LPPLLLRVQALTGIFSRVSYAQEEAKAQHSDSIGGLLLRKLPHGDKIVALGLPYIIHLTGMLHE